MGKALCCGESIAIKYFGIKIVAW
ncbi:hypothetical protein DCAR_0831375 [Daucus carota subsp. sativus]|uniref:Uncharacterized protein n=1 Tax=Daucus carota subsp. sativus TaxID=79200 RepID=A0AAF0XRN0_DAUCS|nr:hypothetical protein DCAR_0831375 [Daucus carota subsp. sativus]